ncbi:MAG: LuxR C-terminal-related transcriptional regulator [Hyphomicrobiales bacterium]|jgi:FixJ family two-component response regulator|nr:LuxR C-terminal-related transcriptional regulator [Hyphomicrobiales bacterium]
MQDERGPEHSDPVASGATPRPRRTFSGSQALTDREHDVLEAIIAGETSKMAARRFGLSPRTIEVHRAHILAKCGARNTADLLRIVLNGQK